MSPAVRVAGGIDDGSRPRGGCETPLDYCDRVIEGSDGVAQVLLYGAAALSHQRLLPYRHKHLVIGQRCEFDAEDFRTPVTWLSDSDSET